MPSPDSPGGGEMGPAERLRTPSEVAEYLGDIGPQGLPVDPLEQLRASRWWGMAHLEQAALAEDGQLPRSGHTKVMRKIYLK